MFCKIKVIDFSLAMSFFDQDSLMAFGRIFIRVITSDDDVDRFNTIQLFIENLFFMSFLQNCLLVC